MRTLLLTTVLFTFCPAGAFTQSLWLADDHRWTFHMQGGFIGVDDYYTQKVDKDTFFLGTPCKKIVYESNGPLSLASFLAYEDDHKLFVTHPYDTATWYKGYDFTLAPNAYFATHPTILSPLFKVDFYDLVMVDGQEVPRQRLLALNLADSTETGEYYDVLEGIGNIGHWGDSMPYCSEFTMLYAPFCESFVDGFDRRFICFSSNDLQYAPYAGCTVSGTQHPQQGKPKVTVGPNPVHDLLQLGIEGDDSMQSVLITDVQGRVLLTQTVKNAVQWNIHLGDLPTGMYMLSVRCETGVYTQLLVKNL